MNHDHQPAAGHLTFPGGGVVTGDVRTVEERILAGEHVPAEEIAALPGSRVDIVPGTPESAAAAWNAAYTPQPAVMPHALGTPAPNTVPASRPGEPQTHTMPSGHTVTVAPLESLTRRDRTQLLKLNQELSVADDPERGKKIMDAILVRIILAWTYPWPVPSADPESLERLPMTDVWDVERLTVRADKLLFVGPVTPDDHADPTSPTAPSGE